MLLKLSKQLLSVAIIITVVLAQPPTDWTVNPSDFEHVMTVTGSVHINDRQTDSATVLAAFVGTECRGVASTTLVQDDWLHFLMVRANTANENISFQVWDAAFDTVLIANNELSFVPDEAHGTVDTPYLIEALNQYTLLVANADSVTLNEDIITELFVLNNDEYSNASFQQLIILQVPANGSAQVNANQTITYSPDQDWFGVDSLSYIIINTWYTDTAEVILNVVAVNDAPGSFNQLAPVNNTNIAITANNLGEQLVFRWVTAVDVENDQVTYSVSFTGSLDVLTIPITPDTIITFSYADLLSAISDNGYSSITGTWQIIASDTELEQPADNGPFTLTIDASSVSTETDNNNPAEFQLFSNYPNPFNPTTTIQYNLPQRSDVQITIYDLLGRKVTTLISGTQEAGYKSIQWNGRNKSGQLVSAGMYFYAIEAGKHTAIWKMVLLK